jgi:hypothetical protein
VSQPNARPSGGGRAFFFNGGREWDGKLFDASLRTAYCILNSATDGALIHTDFFPGHLGQLTLVLVDALAFDFRFFPAMVDDTF